MVIRDFLWSFLGMGDGGTSPHLHNRMSPRGGKIPLWSSGYEPEEPNQSDLSLFRKSPSKLTGYYQ